MIRKILIADDEEIERRALRRILESEPDWELIEAENGIQALEAAERCRPDLAILDIRMPGIDGIEVAERMRRLYPRMGFIFLTAYDQFDYARSAVRLQVDDFLLKPASGNEIQETVNRVLLRISSQENDQRSSQEARARFDSALRLVADRLRNDLAEGLPDSGQILQFLDLMGLTGGLEALVEVRPVQTGAPLTHVARMAEAAFASGGCVALAEVCGSCVRAILMGQSLSDSRDLPLRIRTFREQVRTELGIPLLAGAALNAQGTVAPLALVRAAHRAATLANQSSPVLVVPVWQGTEDSHGTGSFLDDQAPSLGVSRALQILESRQSEDLSLNEVAHEVGISPSHLSRQLARSTGKGFADCLAQFRIASARKYLRDGSLSVKEVSHLVGFHDPAYFARVFRKHEGCSPAEFRSLTKTAGEAR